MTAGLPPSLFPSNLPRRLGRLLFGRLVVTALALAVLSGCATVRSAGGPADAGAADAGLPWEVPAAALSTQRLYRVSYDGPEGEGSFKLTLRLATPARYQVVAADPLGRSLWSLDAVGRLDAADRPGALWIDHRNRLVCTLEGRFDLARLTPFPIASLPALLLGRLPSPPAPGELAPAVLAALESGGPALPESLSYRDAEGLLWTATLGGTLAGGRPVAWSMREPGEEVAAVTWSTVGGAGAGAGAEAVLSDRGRGVQLRWREVVAEPLAGLAPLAAPEDYRAVDCGSAYAPD